MKNVYNFSLLNVSVNFCESNQSASPIDLIPSTSRPWPPDDGQSTDRGIRRKKMRGLSRTSSEPTLRVLPRHDLVNHPSHVVNPPNRLPKSFNSPLLVPRIQPNLQHTEPLYCPEQQPWLTGVLADVFCWESLDKIPYKELHVRILLEG